MRAAQRLYTAVTEQAASPQFLAGAPAAHGRWLHTRRHRSWACVAQRGFGKPMPRCGLHCSCRTSGTGKAVAAPLPPATPAPRTAPPPPPHPTHPPTHTPQPWASRSCSSRPTPRCACTSGCCWCGCARRARTASSWRRWVAGGLKWGCRRSGVAGGAATRPALLGLRGCPPLSATAPAVRAQCIGRCAAAWHRTATHSAGPVSAPACLQLLYDDFQTDVEDRARKAGVRVRHCVLPLCSCPLIASPPVPARCLPSAPPRRRAAPTLPMPGHTTCCGAPPHAMLPPAPNWAWA